MSGRPDPLDKPAFRPGLWRELRDAFLSPPRPLSCVQMEVTSACSGRCIYCPHTTLAGVWRSRAMSAEVVAALWPLLRRSLRAHLQGWGEPLLHPRFFDFAAFARRAGCRVSTTTCGLGMDEDTAVRLVSGGLDVVAFSLAAPTRHPTASARACPSRGPWRPYARFSGYAKHGAASTWKSTSLTCCWPTEWKP